MSITGALIVSKILEKITDKVVERFSGEPVAEFLADKLTAKRRGRVVSEQHFMNHDITRALCRSYYKALLRITVELKNGTASFGNEYRDPYLPGMLEDQVVRLQRYLREIETNPNPSFPIHSLDSIGTLINPSADSQARLEVEHVLAELPSHLKIDSPEYQEAVRVKCFDYTTRFFAGEIKDNQKVAHKLHAEYIVDQRITLQHLTDTCGSLDERLDDIREIAVGIQGSLQDGVALLDRKITGIQETLADMSGQDKQPADGGSRIADDWQQITDDLLDVPSPELIQAYYEGWPVQWSLVRHGYTAERALTQEIIAFLKPSFFQAVLITGSGGEGKTTIMYQASLALRDQGYSIYKFNKEVMRGCKVDLQFNPKVPSVFLIDDASEISNFGTVFRHFKDCKVPIKLLMTARKNEWLSNGSAIKLSNEYKRYMREFPLKKIGKNEADDIAELLVRNGAVAEQASISEVSERLYLDTNGFLLAGMLQTTQGKDLETIIRSVIDKIKEFENGNNLIDALAVISLIETIGARKKSPYACTTTLFSRILGVDEQGTSKYKKALSGEVFFETLTNTISTRHEKIATIMYDILLESSDEYEMDAGYIYKRLLYAAGDISKERPVGIESDLLSLLPEYIYETKGYEAAVGYFEVALRQNPFRLKSWTDYIKIQQKHNLIGDIHTPGTAVQLCYEACDHYFEHSGSLWYKWAEIERRRNNIGDRDKPYTAVWIAKEGAIRNPDAGLLWCLWAEFEKMCNNEGDIHTPNSARWILHTYVKSGNHDQNVYAFWLRMERESGNIGSVEQLYSARWIASQLTARFPTNLEGWSTWCDIEQKLSNNGDMETPNTARWIAGKGATLNPSSGPLWSLWAQYEWKNGNKGSVDREYSARWILKTYCHAGYQDQNIYGFWLRMERECGNIGTVEEMYTARWIAHQCTLYCPRYAEGWSTWSQFEQEQQNFGSINQQYSAIWLLKEGIEKNHKNGELWKEWAMLEWAKGTIGDINTPNTARWIFAQGTKILPRCSNLWEEWARLELSLGNPGSGDTPYTPRWIAEQATSFIPDTHTGWILRAQIEIDQGNYGSVEEPNSARWIFYQGTQKNGYRNIASSWAKLEYECGNSGELHTRYTGRWILWRGIQEDHENNYNWLRFLSQEFDNGNIGSVDEPSSALWVFDQWFKRNPSVANLTFDFINGFEKVKQLYFANSQQ